MKAFFYGCVVLVTLGYFDEALDVAENALKLCPPTKDYIATIWYEKGRCYEVQNFYREAKNAFAYALSLAPGIKHLISDLQDGIASTYKIEMERNLIEQQLMEEWSVPSSFSISSVSGKQCR